MPRSASCCFPKPTLSQLGPPVVSNLCKPQQQHHQQQLLQGARQPQQVYPPVPTQQYVAPMRQQVYPPAQPQQYVVHMRQQVYPPAQPQQYVVPMRQQVYPPVPTQQYVVHRQQQVYQPAPTQSLTPTAATSAKSPTHIEVQSTTTNTASSAPIPLRKTISLLKNYLEIIPSNHDLTKILTQDLKKLELNTNVEDTLNLLKDTFSTLKENTSLPKLRTQIVLLHEYRHKLASNSDPSNALKMLFNNKVLQLKIQLKSQELHSAVVNDLTLLHELKSQASTPESEPGQIDSNPPIASPHLVPEKSRHSSPVSQSDEKIYNALIALINSFIYQSKPSTSLTNLRLEIANYIDIFLNRYETLNKRSAGEKVKMTDVLKSLPDFLVNLKKLVKSLPSDHPAHNIINSLLTLSEQQSSNDSVLSAASTPESSPVKQQLSEINTLVSDLSKEFEQAFLVEAAKMKSYVLGILVGLTNQKADINNLIPRTPESQTKQNKILLVIHNDLKFYNAVLDSINHLTKNQTLNLNFDSQTTKAIQLISKLSCDELLKKLFEKHCPTISEFFKIYNKIQPLTNLKPNTISSAN